MSEIIEKEYYDFNLSEVQTFQTNAQTVKFEKECLIFEGINFNSGLLSFGSEFINCSIGSSLWNRTIISDDPDSEPQEIIMSEIKKFNFVDCKFSNDTSFEKDLEHLEFVGCIFENPVELFDCKINLFQCKNVDFKSYVATDNVEFSEKVIFEYVSFMGHLYIRNSSFFSGLDLDNANLEKEMTFHNNRGLDTSKSIKNTSQETYRIIKYQLETVGNIIASNKYQALELQKHRKNSWRKIKEDFLDCKFVSNDLLDGIVAFFHWISSNHSRNWFWTLIWIFIVGAGTNYLIGHEFTLECTFKYLSIININDECLKNHPIIAVLNKVLLGYLYYQFLTAIRRNTRK